MRVGCTKATTLKTRGAAEESQRRDGAGTRFRPLVKGGVGSGGGGGGGGGEEAAVEGG